MVEQTADALPTATLDERPADDLWQRMRPGLQFAQTQNARVRDAEAYYLDHPGFLAAIEPRARRYLYFLVAEVERRGLPMELALLPLVESLLDPFAVSPQRAAGLWQIMPATADHLGMRRDWWFDGRHDLRVSTAYALDYLTALHREFGGDWLLALAAYNAGKGRVQRALRHNRSLGRPDDFWSLSLPKETRRYVPRLLALSRMISNAETLGVALPAIDNRPAFAVVDLGGQLEMLRAASLAGIDLTELRRYNPGHLRWATPPDLHELLVPLERAAQMRAGLASLPGDQRVTWQRYRIRRGDSLIGIAGRFDTEVGLLREVNNLRGNFIRAGDTLMIPDSSAWQESLALASGQRGGVRRGYTVRRGDSLYEIARRFNVSIDQLISWNRLDPQRYLQPGQALTLYVD